MDRRSRATWRFGAAAAAVVVLVAVAADARVMPMLESVESKEVAMISGLA